MDILVHLLPGSIFFAVGSYHQRAVAMGMVMGMDMGMMTRGCLWTVAVETMSMVMMVKPMDMMDMMDMDMAMALLLLQFMCASQEVTLTSRVQT